MLCPEGSNDLHHLGVNGIELQNQVCWYFPFLLEHFVTVNKERVILLYVFLSFCRRTLLHSSHLAVLFPVWYSAFPAAAGHGFQLNMAICERYIATQPITAQETVMGATITMTYLQSDGPRHVFFLPKQGLPYLD